jgi:hemolysin type calcium-binding protein
MFFFEIAPAAFNPRLRRLLAALVAVCALLAVGRAAPADAAVGCQFSTGGALTIQSSAAQDGPRIVRSGDNIVVGNDWQGPSVACSGAQATVHNTHVIAYSDGSGGQTYFLIDLRGGPFSPGQVDEPGSTDEIDIQADLGSGDGDRLYIWGSPGGDFLRLGQTANGAGVNLNAGDESAPGATPDSDVDLRGAEMATIYADDGNDHVLAGGGPEFSGPFPMRIDVNGGSGDDEVAGGDGQDNITDGPGNDRVSGGADNDTIAEYPPAGDDTFDGGPGSDHIAWAEFTDAMHVDLRIAGRQDTGAAGHDAVTGFENASTAEGNDVLIGTDGPNNLRTGDGNDVIAGLGGTDRIEGDMGENTASYAIPPGGVTQGVTVSLFKQNVVQDTGGAGVDQLEGIQNLVGSPYADTLVGNDANNRFDVRDGQGDRVTCANGVDAVVADVEGTDVLGDDCDQVDFDFRPDTRIDAGAAGLIRDRTPSFRFSATKQGSSFECSLDGGPFAACPSAHTLGRLANGAHILRVRSRDMLGALDLSPAERAFSVDATPPRISRARILPGGRIEYRLSEAASVEIAIRRCVRAHGGRCSRFGRPKTVVRQAITGVNWVARRHGIPAGLARGDRYRVTLRATDRAGNRSRRIRPRAN